MFVCACVRVCVRRRRSSCLAQVQVYRTMIAPHLVLIKSEVRDPTDAQERQKRQDAFDAINATLVESYQGCDPHPAQSEALERIETWWREALRGHRDEVKLVSQALNSRCQVTQQTRATLEGKQRRRAKDKRTKTCSLHGPEANHCGGTLQQCRCCRKWVCMDHIAGDYGCCRKCAHVEVQSRDADDVTSGLASMAVRPC